MKKFLDRLLTIEEEPDNLPHEELGEREKYITAKLEEYSRKATIWVGITFGVFIITYLIISAIN